MKQQKKAGNVRSASSGARKAPAKSGTAAARNKIEQLERAVIRTALRRYAEWVKQYPEGIIESLQVSRAACAHLRATAALARATGAKS